MTPGGIKKSDDYETFMKFYVGTETLFIIRFLRLLLIVFRTHSVSHAFSIIWEKNNDNKNFGLVVGNKNERVVFGN